MISICCRETYLYSYWLCVSLCYNVCECAASWVYPIAALVVKLNKSLATQQIFYRLVYFSLKPIETIMLKCTKFNCIEQLVIWNSFLTYRSSRVPIALPSWRKSPVSNYTTIATLLTLFFQIFIMLSKSEWYTIVNSRSKSIVSKVIDRLYCNCGFFNRK